MAKQGIALEVNTQSLDVTIEKANRLVELLQEATQIIDSLSTSKSLVEKTSDVQWQEYCNVETFLSNPQNFMLNMAFNILEETSSENVRLRVLDFLHRV